MKRICAQRAIWRLALAVALVGTGLSCTNSEAIRSANSPVALQVELTNTATRYEFALVTLAQIRVKPVDPQAQEALGAQYSIGALPPIAAQDLDLNVATALPTTNFVLATGTYSVSRIVFGQLTFIDTDFAGDETTCATQNSYEAPGLLQLTNLGSNYSFSIQTGNQSTLNMDIDAAAFVQAVEAASRPVAGGGCTVNAGDLSALAPTFLTLSAQ